MALTSRQAHELREAVRLLWNELNQCIGELENLKRIRERYGEDVVTALADLITPAEWVDVHARVTAWRDTLWARIEAQQGTGLGVPGEPDPLTGVRG